VQNKLLYFILGFISSIIIYSIFINYKSSKNKAMYFILDKDYELEQNGMLKKGTIIKYDAGMSEGFDRFILYINIKGNDFIRDTNEIYDIVPYWLVEIDSSKKELIINH